ncbi:hypothetical protein GCM10009549_54730 [Streptomyces thermoalcalitolerans]|uniref:Uncharacterized protein n=1 Tax=Streptomyces thermoalcalitolerans TaxID=65605 RepID=A0ABN1PPA2_9ACTN
MFCARAAPVLSVLLVLLVLLVLSVLFVLLRCSVRVVLLVPSLVGRPALIRVGEALIALG